jgi:uncharacterized protein YdeI (YjbR/CyaY-like superfamily)
LVPDPQAIHAFVSETALARWYAKNHRTQSELFVRIYKKDSGVPSVNYAQALDEALCWGWIDGVRKAYDEQSFLQRFTPRRPKSIWSQINREHVARLIAAERMTAHGLAQVEAAKADGRWDAAYASAKTMKVPEDLLAAIEANAKARKTYATLSKQNLFALAFRLTQLKTPDGRKKRIEAFVQMLARGETLHPSGRKEPARSAARKRERPR